MTKHVTIGVAIGLTIPIALITLWRPVLRHRVAWIFTRIPPETHPDCKPRMRTWKNGIEIVSTNE